MIQMVPTIAHQMEQYLLLSSTLKTPQIIQTNRATRQNLNKILQLKYQCLLLQKWFAIHNSIQLQNWQSDMSLFYLYSTSAVKPLVVPSSSTSSSYQSPILSCSSKLPSPMQSATLFPTSSDRLILPISQFFSITHIEG